MTANSNPVRAATIATDSGELDVVSYVEAARSGTVQYIAHDSAKRVTYVSIRESRGRIFRLHHDTERIELFSDLYDVKCIALVPSSHRTDTDYMMVCDTDSAAVYSVEGKVTTLLWKYGNNVSLEKRAGAIISGAFDASCSAIISHSVDGPRVMKWGHGETSCVDLKGGILFLSSGMPIVAGPGVDCWADLDGARQANVGSLSPLSNMIYGGRDADGLIYENILCGAAHEPRSGMVIACTPHAVWSQDNPEGSGATPSCHMI